MTCTSKHKEHSEEGQHHYYVPVFIVDSVYLCFPLLLISKKRANCLALGNYSWLIKALCSNFMMLESNERTISEDYKITASTKWSTAAMKFVSMTVHSEINANGFHVYCGDFPIYFNSYMKLWYLIHPSGILQCFSNHQQSSLTTFLN